MTRETILKQGVVTLFNHQTDSEKKGRFTEEDNDRGFNQADAKILSSIAVQILARKELSKKQVEILADRLPKYGKQLARITKSWFPMPMRNR